MFVSRIRELESRLAKISQADRAEDAKQKELIHGLKVDNVDLNLRISELERDLVSSGILREQQAISKRCFLRANPTGAL